MYFHLSPIGDDVNGSNMGLVGFSDQLCNISPWSDQNFVALLIHELALEVYVA